MSDNYLDRLWNEMLRLLRAHETGKVTSEPWGSRTLVVREVLPADHWKSGQRKRFQRLDRLYKKVSGVRGRKP